MASYPVKKEKSESLLMILVKCVQLDFGFQAKKTHTYTKKNKAIKNFPDCLKIIYTSEISKTFLIISTTVIKATVAMKRDKNGVEFLKGNGV